MTQSGHDLVIVVPRRPDNKSLGLYVAQTCREYDCLEAILSKRDQYCPTHVPYVLWYCRMHVDHSTPISCRLLFQCFIFWLKLGGASKS